MAEVPPTEIEIRLRGIPGESDKSPAVDVIASATRKYAHRPFGTISKKIAAAIKAALNGDTSNWNRKWALATKTFSELWNGHNPENVKAVMVEYGVRELKLPADVARKIVDAVINVFPDIAAERGIWASKSYKGAPSVKPTGGAGTELGSQTA